MTAAPTTIAELVDILGGTSAVARELELAPSTVSGWRRCDAVPPTQHARLLAVCVAKGVYWRPPEWPPQAQLRWNPRIDAAAA
jgi:hypothetical protein